jgi:hypothetical protein
MEAFGWQAEKALRILWPTVMMERTGLDWAKLYSLQLVTKSSQMELFGLLLEPEVILWRLAQTE